MSTRGIKVFEECFDIIYIKYRVIKFFRFVRLIKTSFGLLKWSKYIKIGLRVFQNESDRIDLGPVCSKNEIKWIKLYTSYQVTLILSGVLNDEI